MAPTTVHPMDEQKSTTDPRLLLRHSVFALIVPLLLFLAAWIPRTVALDAFATPDEPTWLARSANFYHALTHQNYEQTFQTVHPGVTAMWAGTLGFVQRYPSYAQETPGQMTDEGLEAWLKQNTTISPLEMLVAGRWWIVFTIALAIASAYFPLRRLFGLPSALLISLFVAWSPFSIALSRQLHLDGLLAGLIYLALLTFLAWLYAGQQWRYLLVSGLALGLAVLTKAPAVWLPVSAGLLLMLEVLRRRREGDDRLSPMVMGFIAWAIVGLVTAFALWPALWVSPVSVLDEIVESMTAFAGGHVLPNFFLGEITGDPGLLFYPVAVLFRVSPTTLVGLALVGLVAGKGWWPLDTSASRRGITGVFVFALVFAVGMTLGAKKFDRYLLPTFLALDVMAALGWLGLGHGALRWWRQRRRSDQPYAPPTGPASEHLSWAPILAAAILVLHGLPAVLHYPYYLTYYNPLVGGSRTAPHVMMIGWGEGLDAAAQWINQQSAPSSGGGPTVVSWYHTGPMSFFLQSSEKVLSPYLSHAWFEADYAVLYANQWQRDLPSPEFVDYYSALSPSHVVNKDGLELARVYDMRGLLPPAFTNISTASAASFAAPLRLAAHRSDKQSVLPGDAAQITLFWEALQPLEDDYRLLLHLVAPDGTELGRQEGWPAEVGDPSQWTQGEMSYVPLEISVPIDAAPGKYELSLALLPPSGGAPLPISGATDQDGWHPVTWIEVQPLVDVDVEASWQGARLTGVRHQPQLNLGEPFNVTMAAEGKDGISLKISARLVSATGEVRAQQDQFLGRAMRFDLGLPADADTDPYALTVVIYDPATLEPLPDDQGNLSTVLTTLAVSGAEN